MELLYTFIIIPSYLVFLFYRGRNRSINDDFFACREKHKIFNMTERQAFTKLMMSYPEYRYLLYYRLPFFPRHLLNLILRRGNSHINTKDVGGGNNRARLEFINSC